MAVLLTKERKFKIMSKTVLKKCSPWSCPVFFNIFYHIDFWIFFVAVAVFAIIS